MHTAWKRTVIAVALAWSTPTWAAPHSLPRHPAHVRNPPDGTHPAVHRVARKAVARAARTGAALLGPNGEIRYAYGASHPEVPCAPLHLCVVALLRGEKIVDLSIGDSVRWLVEPAQAGTRPIVIIKPTTAGIETNLVITTDDGHLYDLNLVARRTRFVPEIGFYDPKALVETVTRAQARKARRARTVVATLPSIDPAKLHFAYWWTGPKADRPVRVFSADGKVYIQMPARLQFGEMPAVFVVVHGAQQLVNYQVVGSYFVVDALFQEARLLLGVGAHRRVVTLHAGKKPLFSW